MLIIIYVLENLTFTQRHMPNWSKNVYAPGAVATRKESFSIFFAQSRMKFPKIFRELVDDRSLSLGLYQRWPND
jgi:hypothetical protein